MLFSIEANHVANLSIRTGTIGSLFCNFKTSLVMKNVFLLARALAQLVLIMSHVLFTRNANMLSAFFYSVF